MTDSSGTIPFSKPHDLDPCITKKRALAHTETKGFGVKNVLSTFWIDLHYWASFASTQRRKIKDFKNYFC